MSNSNQSENPNQPPKTPQQEDFERRQQLGAAGKLYCIEVLFKDGLETRRYEYRNATSAEVMQFRERIFVAGLKICMAPDRWKVFAPWDIISVDIQRQQKFFPQ